VMHQHHHTKEGARQNYGGVLSVWDHLWGTANTQHDNAMHFGIQGHEHTTLGSMFIEPFTSLQGKKV